MIKTKKDKFLQSFENVKLYKDLIRIAKVPYKMILSNYTTELICPYLNLDLMFCNSFQSQKMFMGFNMIKRDLLKWSANEQPLTTYEDVIFFENNIKESLQYKDIINLDLNSAYATVLLNDYFIEKKTYSFLQTIPKIDRLACVGMFASKKTLYEFGEDGNVANWEVKEANTSGYFIHCIKKVGDLMTEIKNAIGDDFLMFWVDGIYIKNNGSPSVKIARKIIEDHRYNYKEKILPTFKTFKSEKNKIKVILGEEYSDHCKIKEFNYPAPPTEFQKDFTKYLKTFINN